MNVASPELAKYKTCLLHNVYTLSYELTFNCAKGRSECGEPRREVCYVVSREGTLYSSIEVCIDHMNSASRSTIAII